MVTVTRIPAVPAVPAQGFIKVLGAEGTFDKDEMIGCSTVKIDSQENCCRYFFSILSLCILNMMVITTFGTMLMIMKQQLLTVVQ